MKTIEYSWQEVNDDVITLAKMIFTSGFKPHAIVGIVRGGAVPAVMMSHLFGVPMIPIQWSNRDFHESQPLEWSDIIQAAYHGKRFLLVEDIVDSGDTLREMLLIGAENYNPLSWRSNLKLSSLYFNTAQEVKVDYAVRMIDRRVNQAWVEFPWEMKRRGDSR